MAQASREVYPNNVGKTFIKLDHYAAGGRGLATGLISLLEAVEKLDGFRGDSEKGIFPNHETSLQHGYRAPKPIGDQRR